MVAAVEFALTSSLRSQLVKVLCVAFAVLARPLGKVGIYVVRCRTAADALIRAAVGKLVEVFTPSALILAARQGLPPTCPYARR